VAVPEGVRHQQADLAEPESLAPALDGAEVLFLLQRSATTVLIPGTSSLAHLRENIAAADLKLPAEAVTALDAIGQ
jgi:aryl-alcohol dehydrogenase-like predicted oxidoreductase